MCVCVCVCVCAVGVRIIRPTTLIIMNKAAIVTVFIPMLTMSSSVS